MKALPAAPLSWAERPAGPPQLAKRCHCGNPIDPLVVELHAAMGSGFPPQCNECVSAWCECMGIDVDGLTKRMMEAKAREAKP